MTTEEMEKGLVEYLNCHKCITTPLGILKLTNSDRIGQGGNGLVYSAKINEEKVAIKFLIATSDSKLNRFKSEYFNTNYVRDEIIEYMKLLVVINNA